MKGTFIERQKKPKKPKDDEEAKKRRKAAKEQARALAQQNNPGGLSGGSECYSYYLFINVLCYAIDICVYFSTDVPEQPPNQILFLTNLPDETTEMMLSMLFNQ